MDSARRPRSGSAKRKKERLNLMKAKNGAGTITSYVYRINDGVSSSASILQQVCEERGWKEFNSEERRHDEWNFWWRTTTMKLTTVRQLTSRQHTNHIPKATTFCRKDFLARYLRRMHRTHGPIYDFSPKSFNLPLEYTRLCSEHSRRTRILQYGDPSTCDEPNLPFTNRPNQWLDGRQQRPIWICKPVGKSQGKGILVFDKVAELAYDGSSVVQEYIVRPYLIGGYKWDLRIYACILSVQPLMIYAYREGLTRFATNKYNLSSLYDQFSHLTNSSLNKLNPACHQIKEQIGSGCKWTLGKLRQYFHDHGVMDWPLWQRIMSILVLTIIGDAHTLTSLEVGSTCFEFLGFDILVDQNLQPTLLEVNTNPGLGNDCLVDEKVKIPMLHQLFTLLGLPGKANSSNDSDEDEKDGNIAQGGLDLARLRSCENKVGNKEKLALVTGPIQTGRGSVSSRDERKGPINKENDFPEYTESKKYRPAGECSYGDWIRIFPVDTQSNKDKTPMSILDIKMVITRMQNYLRIVDRIASKQSRDDQYNDTLAKHYGHLSTEPWHPSLVVRS